VPRQSQLGHHGDDLVSFDALIDLDRQRLAREGVDNGQRTKPATVEQCIGDKIHRPQRAFGVVAAGCRSRLAALTCRRGRFSLRLSPSSRYSR
jgi:hypothetical protein